MSTRLLHAGRHALSDLFDIRLALVTGLFVLLLVGAAQLPVRYPVLIGQEDGPGGDLPLISRFYGASTGPNGAYRWSGERSTVRLPGFSGRPLLLTLSILPLPDEAFAAGQPQASIWVADRLVAPLQVRPNGARYHLLLPPLPDPRPLIEFRSSTFRVSGDDRDLGIPVGALLIQRAGAALPPWSAVLPWLFLPLLCWAGLRWSGFSQQATVRFCLIVLLLVASAALLDPPRVTLAAQPLLSALVLAIGLCCILRATMPQIARRCGHVLTARSLRWLLLFALLIFTLREGGKSMPGAMPGDIGFHTHRFEELIEGQILLSAPHRGVLSPYPSALYLILAPVHVSGIALPELLHLSAALFDALSPFLIYLIVVLGFRQRAHAERLALIAAGFYALAPGNMLASWWNFSTHIFGQTMHLVLVATILLIFQRAQRTDQPSSRSALPPALLAILLVLEYIVYLSHFSYYLNESLLLGGATALLVALALLRMVPGWMGRLAALTSLAGQVVAFSLFYSYYLGTLSTQVGTVGAAQEGTALQNTQSLLALIESLLGEGLREHTGLFPAVLALVGIGLGLQRLAGQRRDGARSPTPALLVLSGLTLLIALGFAFLPLFSSANLTTRWLMFSLWAIAVWSAPAALRYWRRGRAGQLMIILIGAYLFWISAAIWLQALAWRVRPPEPF